MKKELTSLERNIKIRFFNGDSINKISEDTNRTKKQVINIINRINKKRESKKMNKQYVIIERFNFIEDKNATNNIWYDFSNIPQKDNYITICALPIKTDRKAINRAKKINPNYEYIIKDRA